MVQVQEGQPPRETLRRPPLFDPEQGTTVRRPVADSPGHWAGAPAIYRDPASGDFYLTYRLRRERGTEPDRGYVGYVAKSADGVHFDDIWSVAKEELGSPSMERFCLRRAGDLWLLYISYVDPADNRWRIDVLTADSPSAFSAARRQPVFTAADTGTEGIKDPYVIQAGPAWLMYASYAVPASFSTEDRAAAHASADIYTTGLTTFPTGLATSLDGLRYAWQGEALPVGAGWDAYQARITGIVPAGPGWLGMYDGSADETENYEERAGLALCFEPTRWIRLTPGTPALTSPHATGSLRYVDAVSADGNTYYYYEYARSDGAHELRVSKVAGT